MQGALKRIPIFGNAPRMNRHGSSQSGLVDPNREQTRVLIDSSHKKWATFTLAALAVSGAYFAFYYHKSFNEPGGNGPTGASWPGLAFGAVGFGMMIFCGLLGVRRTVRIWRLGRAQSWLRAHIWLGLLAFPLILFHSGLRFGPGPSALAFWLMVLFSIVLVSGIVGVLLQNIVPRSMLLRVQAETTFEQIPFVVDSLRHEADGLVRHVCGPLGNEKPGDEAEDEAAITGGAFTVMKKEGAVQGKVGRARNKAPIAQLLEGSAPLKGFYINEVQPYLSPVFSGGSKLATQRSAVALFQHTRTLLPDPLHETLRDLESVCDERRQLALQSRLHFWLHVWEFVHVPLSYALLAMSVVHAVVASVKY